jgi:hypothetical protein
VEKADDDRDRFPALLGPGEDPPVTARMSSELKAMVALVRSKK